MLTMKFMAPKSTLNFLGSQWTAWHWLLNTALATTPHNIKENVRDRQFLEESAPTQ